MALNESKDQVVSAISFSAQIPDDIPQLPAEIVDRFPESARAYNDEIVRFYFEHKTGLVRVLDELERRITELENP